MLPITSTFAALTALAWVGLTVWVILGRRTLGVSLGDGGHPTLQRRIRAHANFTESMPLFLILMGLAEANQVHIHLLIIMGIIMFIGRALHAVALTRASGLLRVAGMACTFTPLTTLACALIVYL